MAVTMMPIARPCAAAMPSKSDSALAGGGQVLIGADRTSADENQSERADEFGDQLLRKTVHVPPCIRKWADSTQSGKVSQRM